MVDVFFCDDRGEREGEKVTTLENAKGNFRNNREGHGIILRNIEHLSTERNRSFRNCIKIN